MILVGPFEGAVGLANAYYTMLGVPHYKYSIMGPKNHNYFNY